MNLFGEPEKKTPKELAEEAQELADDIGDYSFQEIRDKMDELDEEFRDIRPNKRLDGQREYSSWKFKRSKAFRVIRNALKDGERWDDILLALINGDSGHPLLKNRHLAHQHTSSGTKTIREKDWIGERLKDFIGKEDDDRNL